MTIDWFIENGCELVHPDIKLLYAIYELENGQPCNGCNCKQTCPAYPKLLSVNKYDSELLRCPKCNSLLNPVKVQRRNGLCACGYRV